MAFSDWLNVLAVLLSPLVALQVSTWLDKRREARARRLNVFRTLMATRATGLSADHVQALNMIDIEFTGADRASKAVRDRWREYLDHLGTRGSSEVWHARREDLFVELLHAMGTAVNYEFDKTHIRRSAYFPRGHGELERDQQAIRRAVVDLLEGRRSLPIWVLNDGRSRPPDQPLPVVTPEQAALPSPPTDSSGVSSQ